MTVTTTVSYCKFYISLCLSHSSIHKTFSPTMSSRTLSSAINRVAAVSQQLSSQQAIKSQVRNASTSSTTFKLNTGASIPAIGFGTWQDKDAQEPAVLAALKAGYRHIDTARIYGTEPAVGSAIKKSGVPREEVCVHTITWVC
jgi:hypothetical protein